MTEKTKDIIKLVGKIALLVVLGLFALITGAALWHAAALGCVSGFCIAISVLNFLMEGVGLYFLGRKLFKKKAEPVVEEAQTELS